MTPTTLVEPSYLWVPPHASSAAQEAVDFGAQVGMVADAPQRLVLDAMLAEDAAGRRVAFEAAVVVPRQNLKTWVLRLIVLHELFVLDQSLVVWTSHRFSVTMEAFRDCKAVIEGNDALRRRVKRISNENGSEGIELVGGARLLFKARTNSGGRGLSAPRVVLDEAQELTPAMMGSLLPTLSAMPNPQVFYGGSAGKLGSAVWRSVRDRGRGGGDPSLAWVEWSAPVTRCAADACDHLAATPGCALDDRALWAMANPTLGARIAIDHVDAERRSLPPEEFVRERLGWWDEPTSAVGGIGVELWDGRKVNRGDGALLALAVDVRPDYGAATVAAAYGTAAGDLVVSVVARQAGTNWCADRVAALCGDGVPVVVDRRGPAAVIVRDLERDDVKVVSPSGAQLAEACASFVDGLVRGTVGHLGQSDLDDAVRGAARAPYGDAWRWSRKSSAVDISPLVAVTLATWGAQAEPPRDIDVAKNVW